MREQKEIEFAHSFLEEILKSFTSGMHQDDVLNVIIMRDSLEWVLEIGEEEFSESLRKLNEHAYGRTN